MANTGDNPNLLQVLAAIQTQLQTMGDRLNRIEQRLQGGGEGHVPDLNDDPPRNQPQQRQHNPPEHQRQRDPFHRGRMRDDEFARQGNMEVKLTAPTFAGRVNPEVYLDWKNRMEHILDYYGYSDQKKVALAAAQLTDSALTWWDREVAERRRHRHAQITTWDDMWFSLQKRYVPPYFYRDLQKRFRQCVQRNQSVEEYFEEFEQLKNRLEFEESEETLMAQFLDGLQDRIARKVERQPYHYLGDLLHLAIQAEQHIQRKVASTTRSKSHWNIPSVRNVDKEKSLEVESRFKKQAPATSKEAQTEQSKFKNNQRARDITCFKCQGKGHMARECPNNRVMIITSTGDYESQDENEENADGSEDDVEYPDVGELLVTSRMLSIMVEPETIQRENIFHTRCTVNSKVCSLIIDGGSCTNVASKYMVEKLGLQMTKHPRPYKLRWLNDEVELKIADQVTVPFSVGKYSDQVICDVVPMKASHLLLGRPWQFDKETMHNGRTNYYSFTHDKRKYNLALLTPLQVQEMQIKFANDSKVSRTNLSP